MSSGAAMRRVITLCVGDQLLCLRGLSPERLRFEVEYGLDGAPAPTASSSPAPRPPWSIPPGSRSGSPFLKR